MSNPKISIIVPCWRVESYLDKCVESLVNQTMHEIEIILVDDKSPDRVPEMCDEWTRKDNRIKVIHKSQNEGLGLACNTGIECATGKYIAFCDSDDWVDLDMYENMFKEAEAHQADAVITGLKRVDTTGRPCGGMRHYDSYTFCEGRDDVNELVAEMIAASPERREDRYIEPSAKATLYAKAVIDKYNLRFPSEREVPSEDLIFNLYFLQHSQKISILPQRFYNYRITPGSISKDTSKGLFESKYAVLYQHLKQICKAQDMGDKNEARIARMIIGLVRIYIFRIINSSWTVREKKAEIGKISSNPIWREIWDNYPKGVMPLVHRIPAEACNRKCYLVLFLLAKLKH